MPARSATSLRGSGNCSVPSEISKARRREPSGQVARLLKPSRPAEPRPERASRRPQPSPDGIGIDGPANPADVVVTGENAVVHTVISRLGLANQGLPGASISDDNVIEGNDQDRLDDGELEVPDEAMELPDIPVVD